MTHSLTNSLPRWLSKICYPSIGPPCSTCSRRMWVVRERDWGWPPANVAHKDAGQLQCISLPMLFCAFFQEYCTDTFKACVMFLRTDSVTDKILGHLVYRNEYIYSFRTPFGQPTCILSTPTTQKQGIRWRVYGRTFQRWEFINL